MKKQRSYFLWFLILVCAICGYYLWKQSNRVAEQPSAPPLNVASAPTVKFPISPQNLSGANPLPSLNESDPPLQEELVRWFGKELFEELFNSHELIRRCVVTVDNMTARQLPADFLPFIPPKPFFRVSKHDQRVWVDSKNSLRYEAYMQLAKRVDAKQVSILYFRYYPLIQSAYAELGNGGYFNDRLIEVIDHLLSTPEATEPIEVIPFNMSYKYARTDLEQLSAGQKILIRLGEKNRKVIQVKLKELRSILTRH